MKIRYKAIIIMLTAVLMVSAISGYIYYRMNLKLIQEGMQKNLQTVVATIQANIQFRSSQAASIASLIVNQVPVQEALRAKNREKLAQLVTLPLNIQKEKFGEVDAHFHIPPAVSFLRVYKPDTFGDDLSKTRELVLSAQTQQRPLEGVEISTTGVSIKGIDIVKDKQGFVGTFEVGESFSSVLEVVKKITGFDAAAFVNNDLMNQIATKAPVPDKDRIIGGYRNIFATSWDIFQTVATPKLMNQVNETIFKTETIAGHFDGIAIIPLLDFKGQNIGSIWAVGDFSNYQKELRINLILSLALVLLQSLILSAVVLIVFNALYLLPIDNIATRTNEISEGKLTPGESELARWLNRKDEIGILANAIQKLKAKL